MGSRILMVEEVVMEGKEAMVSSLNNMVFAVNNKIVTVVAGVTAVVVAVDRVTVETIPTQSSWEILEIVTNKVLIKY